MMKNQRSPAPALPLHALPVRFPLTGLRPTGLRPTGLRPTGLLLTGLLLTGLLLAPSTALAGPAREAPTHRQYADDPGIQKSIEGVLDEARKGVLEKEPVTPHGSRFRFYYRGYEFRCVDKPCMYNGLGIVAYPTAFLDVTGFWRALRLGIGLAGAGESTQERTTWWQHNFGLEVILAVGLQYPYRFTPYVELLVTLGALHRNIYNKDFIDFAYSFGIEAGFEVFLTGHFNLNFSVGWRRSIVDIGAKTMFADSWTFAVGFGL
ncbi:MAG: hypothetical protein ABI333_26125 [bacterium]